jgi:hypothetical protein
MDCQPTDSHPPPACSRQPDWCLAALQGAGRSSLLPHHSAFTPGWRCCCSSPVADPLPHPHQAAGSGCAGGLLVACDLLPTGVGRGLLQGSPSTPGLLLHPTHIHTDAVVPACKLLLLMDRPAQRPTSHVGREATRHFPHIHATPARPLPPAARRVHTAGSLALVPGDTSCCPSTSCTPRTQCVRWWWCGQAVEGGTPHSCCFHKLAVLHPLCCLCWRAQLLLGTLSLRQPPFKGHAGAIAFCGGPMKCGSRHRNRLDA